MDTSNLISRYFSKIQNFISQNYRKIIFKKKISYRYFLIFFVKLQHELIFMYIHTWWWIAWVNFSSSHLIDTLGGFKLQFFRDTFLVGHSVWMVELAFIAVGAFLVVGTGLRQLWREFHFLSKKLIEIGSIAAKRIIRRHKPKKKNFHFTNFLADFF